MITISPSGTRAEPSTCHGPVMPGVRCSRLRCQPWICASSSRTSGRGPTRPISPRRTLKSCGSSSSDSRRRCWPSRVVRGSSAILNNPSCSLRSRSVSLSSSAPSCIERNFSMENGSPPRPIRVCRKKTGPRPPPLTAPARGRDGGGGGDHERGGEGEQDERADGVEGPLEDDRQAREPEARDAEDRQTIDEVV